MRPLLLLAALTSACTVQPPGPETGASAPSYDVWEARVAAPAGLAFAAALVTLADSGFVPSRADSLQRVIATHPSRREVLNNNHEYRFDAAIIPIGRDSSRIQLRGEWCQSEDGAKRCFVRTAWDDDWVLVRSLGEAMLERLTSR